MLVLVSLPLLLMQGCSGYRDIRVDSCTIEKISPVGLKAVDADFVVGVYNPANRISISGISGKVYYDGGELGTFEAPDVTVPGRQASEVEVDVRAALSQSVTLMQIMGMASHFRPEGFTVDISMKIKIKGGIGKKVVLKGLPVKDLFRKVSYESI